MPKAVDFLNTADKAAMQLKTSKSACPNAIQRMNKRVS